MSLHVDTLRELNLAIKAGAIEEFASMLIDDARKNPNMSKDNLVTNAAYYSIEKLRGAEIEQASIKD